MGGLTSRAHDTTLRGRRRPHGHHGVSPPFSGEGLRKGALAFCARGTHIHGMHNPYTHMGSLHWFDLAPLLRRNAAPWHNIRINFYPLQYARMVTVMDWHLPELALRTGEWKPHKGETLGKASTAETEAHAVVCNMAWLEGECPMANVPAIFAHDGQGKLTNKVIQRPERGVKEALRIMLHQGVLEPTEEVGMVLGDYAMIGAARR